MIPAAIQPNGLNVSEAWRGLPRREARSDRMSAETPARVVTVRPRHFMVARVAIRPICLPVQNSPGMGALLGSSTPATIVATRCHLVPVPAACPNCRKLPRNDEKW